VILYSWIHVSNSCLLSFYLFFSALCAWQAAQSAIIAASGGGGGVDDDATTTLAQLQHRARHHASVALATHKLLFGGGVQRFKRHLGPDLRLNIRPSSVMVVASDGGGGGGDQGGRPCPVDVLWPDEDETDHCRW
jgi:hypothetical protein